MGDTGVAAVMMPDSNGGVRSRFGPRSRPRRPDKGAPPGPGHRRDLSERGRCRWPRRGESRRGGCVRPGSSRYRHCLRQLPAELPADQDGGQSPGSLSGPGPIARISPGCDGRLLA